MIQYYTLIFPVQDGKVLLGYKKRGLGEHLWNGFGGKIETNEEMLDCAVRELEEECGLIVHRENLIYLGYVQYKQGSKDRIVYIYTTDKFIGEPQESEEMKPSWFSFSQIPYDEMWPDSRHWMQLVLNKSFMICCFIYSKDNVLQSYKVSLPKNAPILPLVTNKNEETTS